jgi:hypothetical protein
MPVKSDCQVKPAFLSRFEPVNSNLPKMSGYNTGCHLENFALFIKRWSGLNLEKCAG